MSLRLPGLHVAVVASMAIFASCVAVAAPEPENTDDAVLGPVDQAVIESFERFGLPSVAHAEYVRVWTGQVQQGCCRGRSELSRYGFLLDETETTFRVVHDLWPVTYSKDPGPLQPGGRAPRFEKADFDAIALKPGRRGFSPGRLSWATLVRNRARPSASTEFVFLARAAWQRGRVEAAGKLLAQARSGVQPRVRTSRTRVPTRSQDIDAILTRELPLIFLWSAIQSCGESIPRVTLLERFRVVLTHFPGAASINDAQEFVEILELMVSEDALHGTESDPSATASLELDGSLHELRAPVDELTYALRELRTPHTFRHRPAQRHLDDPKTPSSQLLALGEIATPRLIELSEDRRLTRVIDPYPRRGPASACVLRYGDIALQILSRQAGRTFTTRAQAAEWWAEVEELGEVAVLERMIGEGRSDSVELARKLRSLDPKRAIAAIVGTIDKLKGRDRERLVSYVASQTGPAVDRFLLREVRGGPDLRARLTAARTLERRGVSHWSEPLVAELVSLAKTQSPVSRQRRTSRDVIRFVVPSGSLHALESLRRNYASLNVDERRNLLECAARVPRSRSDRSVVCEAILVSALSDDDHWPHSWSWGGVRCVDSELSEIAAVLLAARMGETFDPGAPPYVRERRIAELRNASLTSSGRAPAPVPEAPVVPTVEDPIELEAALFDLGSALSPGELAFAQARLRAIGLPAVTRLRELLESKTLHPAAQCRGQEVLNVLASTVREVKVTDELNRLTQQDLTDLRNLIGSPLEASTLTSLIKSQTDAGHCLLRVTLHRDGQGRGVTVSLEVRKATIAQAHSRVIYALRNAKRFSRSSLSLAKNKQAAAGWTRFQSRLNGLLGGDATMDGELRLRVGQ